MQDIIYIIIFFVCGCVRMRSHATHVKACIVYNILHYCSMYLVLLISTHTDLQKCSNFAYFNAICNLILSFKRKPTISFY